jgi:cyanophycin synthetase
MKQASDKAISSSVMGASGLPVPRQMMVNSVSAATTAAETIGYPVVVKPNDGSLSKGVSVGLHGPDEIPAAYEKAQREGSRVLVESFLQGNSHRLQVAGGRFIAACKRLAPAVTGDGTRTIGELIEELNADPRRDGNVLSRVPLDEELNRTLRLADCDLDTVLEHRRTIELRTIPSRLTGASTIDVTNHVHPDNRDVAIRAAEIIGLPVAGLDFITPDIGRSYKEVGGGINEINSRANIKMSARPTEGEPQNVAVLMVEATMPPSDVGHLPLAAVAGIENGLVARTLERVLRSARQGVALITDGGATVDGEPAGRRDGEPHEITRSVLRDRRVESLVRTVAPSHVAQQAVLRHGGDHGTCRDTWRARGGSRQRRGARRGARDRSGPRRHGFPTRRQRRLARTSGSGRQGGHNGRGRWPARDRTARWRRNGVFRSRR